jgi:hypothetical protein
MVEGLRGAHRGYHLADPDQWYDLFSRTEARLCRSGSATVVPPTRPRFSLKGRGFIPIRASHPSGSRRWGCSGRWGHHLADPDQWHDLLSRTQARLCRSGSAISVPSTRQRFSLKGRGFTPIRASHPSGSRRWGCSVGSRHPAPGSLSPRKSSVPHQSPSGPRRQGRVGGADPDRSRRPRPGPAGPRIHRSLARCPVGTVQPRAGSMAEASRSQSLLPDGCRREMCRQPIRSGG